jgi:hypothetical protein
VVKRVHCLYTLFIIFVKFFFCSLVYSSRTSDHILHEDTLDASPIDDRKCPNEVHHRLLRELVGSEFDIDISEFLLVMMIAKYTIDHSTDILFGVIDTDLDLIASGDH